MNILFVYRGFGENQTNTVVDKQYEDLTKEGIRILKYPISKGGIWGYLKAYLGLYNVIKKNKIQLIHSHYGYSGIIAGLTFRVPVICSLMGSDVLNQNFFILTITKIFASLVWKKTIVKSKEMQRRIPGSVLIPNGVDFNQFSQKVITLAREITGFSDKFSHILFVAVDINSDVKNYALAQKSYELLDANKIKLHAISNIPQEKLPYYYSAADILLLTSKSEGSPNVVKEALATNCPVVSTNVGDVPNLINQIEGCYITSFSPNDIANKIMLCLNNRESINSREKIAFLDSNVISQQIIGLYKEIMEG